MTLERRLNKIYKQASEELTGKVNSYFAKFEELDKKKRGLVDARKLSEKEYKTWRKNKLLTGADYEALRDNITDQMLETNKLAASYINGDVAKAYTKGFNRVGKQAEGQLAGYSFSLTNEATVKRLATNKKTLLPYKFVDGKKDVRWNTKRVNAQVLQGVLQGEPSSKIAKRMMSVTEMNKDSAVRNARTALTSATNHGRQDAMKQLQDDGVIVEKEWQAAMGDGRTREWHEELNGVSVPIDEPFINHINGVECQIMFPGDPDADPANVYNCRCSIATKIIGFKKKDDSDDEVNKDKGDDDKEENGKQSYSVKDMTKPERPPMPHRSDFDNEEEYWKARNNHEEELAAYKVEKAEFNEKMDEIVETALDNPRFETKEEFVAWAEEKDIELSDDFIEKIDLRAMTETTETLDEMFERFPEAKSFSFYDFDGTMVEPKFSLMADADGFLEYRGGIAFDPNKFADGNFGDALRESLDARLDGYFVMGDGTFSTDIRHEFGHRVESYIQVHVIGQDGITGIDDWRTHFSSLQEYRDACSEVAKKRSEYDADLRSLFKAGMGGQSEYAGQDLRELFAEGFAEWSSGGQTEFGKAFGEFFGRWYK